MSKILTKSKDMSTEYCATVVQVGEVKPIENSDFLGSVMIEGREIVVRKDTVKEGDVMIYVSNECQLNKDFLSINNEFEDVELNANCDDVMSHVEEMQRNGASADDIQFYKQQHRGYFNKYGRVRMKKLRGVMSMGYLIKPETMKNWDPNFDIDIEVGEDFDTVNGNLFVQAYVPPIKEHQQGTGPKDRNRHIKKFNRMIPGQFAFHYDTQQLNRSMSHINPGDVVTISVKLHGTSFICGNVKVKSPRWGGLYKKIFNYLPDFLRFTTEDYDVVYSSRTVIKNSDLNPNVTGGFYGTDVWAEMYQIIKDCIPQGMTVYGEIIGYVTGAQTMIQKGYDYGCKPGENKLMIYRITDRDPISEEFREYNVTEVWAWTSRLQNRLHALDVINNTKFAELIHPIDILYHGPIEDLYCISAQEIIDNVHIPDEPEGLDEAAKLEFDLRVKSILEEKARAENYVNDYDKLTNFNEYLRVHPEEKHILTSWRALVLERMKNDKEKFGMEKNEPLCTNKVPREGIVLRIDDDPSSEAFKLKCLKFLSKESEAMDKGDTSDSEMMERYS